MKVVVDIFVPDGATHYVGEITEAVFFKNVEIAGYDHWFCYDTVKEDWLLATHSRPHFLKPLSEIIVKENHDAT